VSTKCSATLGDFLKIAPSNLGTFDLVIGNPPYNKAQDFAEHALSFVKEDGTIAMLLRLNFLGSQKREAFLREHFPNVYVLSHRPSFTNGGTDATEYAWFTWGATPRLAGLARIL
jgi:methylase of polypeptide subunit release factors